VDIIVVSCAALVASTLTLFSGFGLGTLLMPVMAVFLPVDIAIAVTAIVHFANNIFKVFLLGKRAKYEILICFGGPAVLSAFAGAFVLTALSQFNDTFAYRFMRMDIEVSTVKCVVGLLILCFVAMELMPAISAMKCDKKYLPLGGLLSGFFGGLSGHQGAFRAMFLMKSGVDKESYIATSVVLAMMVDISRLSIYGWGLTGVQQQIQWSMVIFPSLSAFAGAFVGARYIKKITIVMIQRLISGLLIMLAVGLMTGVV